MSEDTPGYKEHEPKFYLTDKDVHDMIVGHDYHHFPGTAVVVCCLHLKNGFKVVGYSSCIHQSDFVRNIADEEAYRNAFTQVQNIAMYLLVDQIHQQGTKGLSVKAAEEQHEVKAGTEKPVSIEPTLGRIMWYKPLSEYEYAGSGMLPSGNGYCFAKVIDVADRLAGVVTLKATDAKGEDHTLFNVIIVQNEEILRKKAKDAGGYAVWMPYQKAQTAKNKPTKKLHS